MNQTVRFRVDFSADCSLGPGKITLLEGIGRTGSLRQAARELGMSYRRAWLLIEQVNRSFDTAATTATVGGSGGGGATLTPFGEKLIERYRSFERNIQSLSCEALAPLASHVNPGAHAKPAARGKTRGAARSPRRRLSHPPSRGRAD